MRTAQDLVDDGMILFPTILDEDFREERRVGMLGSVYIDHDFTPAWLEVPGTLWGDYYGTVTNRANHRWFENLLEDCAPEKMGRPDDADLILAAVRLDQGAYDTQRVLLAYGVEIPTSIETLVEGLQAYPLIDEELVTKLEGEIFENDWREWLESDLRDAAALALMGEDNRYVSTADDDVDAMLGDADSLRALYEEVAAEAEVSPWRVDNSTNGIVPGLYRDGAYESGMVRLGEEIAKAVLRAYVGAGAGLVGA